MLFSERHFNRPTSRCHDLSTSGFGTVMATLMESVIQMTWESIEQVMG
jgi:hypothetical protein